MLSSRTKTIFGWLLLPLVLATCVAIGYGAFRLASYSWDAVVNYRSPYVKQQLPQAPDSPALAQRTVFIIIDGLRLDASREMHTLNSLRNNGTDLELEAPQPSLSFPNWTTLLSGAPPYVSGVVTNWHKGLAPVETLFDVAKAEKYRTVCVGAEGFEQLYHVREKCSAVYLKEWKGSYLSDKLVDRALALTESKKPQLLVVHLPDVDEAGHDFGGASKQYRDTVAQVDYDLNRLVKGLQDGKTVFVVATDHGHIDTGGHGGWESEAVSVPAVFAGPSVVLGKGIGMSQQVAPTVAVIAGLPVPRLSEGAVLPEVLGSQAPTGVAASRAQQAAFRTAVDRVVGPEGAAARLQRERNSRIAYLAAGVIAAVVALALIGIGSWRALVAALWGTAAYYALYNGLFFLVHHYQWSLSSFNAEKFVDSWMNMRLVEAAGSALFGALVAAAVYPLLREKPKGPSGRYLSGWLTLGPATALAILATLGVQVAWFVWWYGINPTWMLPDLKWGFKYDLDLLQATAVGFVAVLTPLVTYLVGRYHPKVRITDSEEYYSWR